ncbi:MAG: hypothetical protein AB7E55_30445 [Pigmentiphaga sp.]
MKLRHINPHNVKHFVPQWIEHPFAVAKWLDTALGDLYSAHPEIRPEHWERRLGFWLELDFDASPFGVRVAVPDGDHEEERLKVGNLIISSGLSRVAVPLNSLLKGSPDQKGTHCIYLHSIMTDCPISYIGITKQAWFARYAQLRQAASSGSCLIFHSALREHANVPMTHRVLVDGLDYQSAMMLEEEFVDMFSLYPKGLNMIPGGFAGLRYLSSLGIAARSAAERDAEIERIANRESIDGRPNPLCAARWASDQDFINRVICGHSGRLSVEQVRIIRLHAEFGRKVEHIAAEIGSTSKKVRDVAAGRRYGRVI